MSNADVLSMMRRKHGFSPDPGPEGKGPYEFTWKEAQETRKDHHRFMKALVSEAEEEGRDLNDRESAAWDQSRACVALMDEALNKLSENGGIPDPGPLARQMVGYPGAPVTGGNSWADDNGRPVRVLGKGESVAEMMGGPDPGVAIGDLMRGAITGKISHLPLHAQQSIGTPSAGGYMVPEPLAASVIDLARSKSRVIEAGASTVPMSATTLKMARVDTDPTPYWRAENEEITESSGTFGQIEFTARTVAILARASIELVEDSVNFNSAIQNCIGEAIATEMDRVAMFGSGQDEEPRGIYNTAGIQFVDVTDGASPPAIEPFASPTVYRPFSQAVEACANKNVTAGDFILSPRTWGTVDRATATDDQPLQPPRSVAERRMLATTQVPDDLSIFDREDASAIFTGLWPSLMFGVRTEMKFEATRVAESAFKKMQILMRMYVRMDVQLQRPEQFVVVRGVAPAVT